MNFRFTSIEEVIANEFFLAWYFREDEGKAKAWEHWLLQHPDYVPLVQESAAWLKANQLSEKPLPENHVDAALAQLQSAIDQAPVVQMSPKRFRWWVPAAAAVIIFLIAGFMYWGNRPDKTNLDSNYGSIIAYQLPDGSQVTLNANSHLSLQKDWKENTDREVWLNGEAFFKIQKTPNHNRFIVHTNAMDIIVTGTQFNVVSLDSVASVLLTEGSVTIRTKDGKELFMKPGDFVQIQNNQAEKKQADQEKVLAWRQSKLDFDNTPMNEVAKIITRHYGVKVTITDPTVGAITVSGVMPNDNLDVLIRALETIGKFRISKGNDGLTISPL